MLQGEGRILSHSFYVKQKNLFRYTSTQQRIQRSVISWFNTMNCYTVLAHRDNMFVNTQCYSPHAGFSGNTAHSCLSAKSATAAYARYRESAAAQNHWIHLGTSLLRTTITETKARRRRLQNTELLSLGSFSSTVRCTDVQQVSSTASRRRCL